MPRRPQPLRIAIDTGGTFTDCVWIDRGRLRMLKVFSTPGDPSQAIVEALDKIAPAGDFILLHGTTVGTNTLLERKGARTALVTTAGFTDVIEIGRQARPRLYDFFVDREEPLVPRERRFGLAERVDYAGRVLRRPSRAEIVAAVRRVARSGAEAVAVCLLFSFSNPAHEKAVARALRARGIAASVSHEILPEFREFERTATTVVNAYLVPVMSGYLREIESHAARATSGGARQRSVRATRPAPVQVRVMQSSGGIVRAAVA